MATERLGKETNSKAKLKVFFAVARQMTGKIGQWGGSRRQG
ncbi:hypothetical protein [Candidatus Electronema sp. PJ]